MPRRKPASVKQRKAELQLKRAVKRGDVPPPEKERKPRPKKVNRRVNFTVSVNSIGANSGQSGLSSKRLASAFKKISPEFLALSKERASTEVLERPLGLNASIFPLNEIEEPSRELPALTCPKRPKWRYDMEKKEVERNEEGLFTKWLAEMDGAVERWRQCPYPAPGPISGEPEFESLAFQDQQKQQIPSILRPPTYFERNLEVWRQLWRVAELSQILLILLDTRCPPVHYPNSLHMYLSALRPARKIILVLTKVDVVGIERAEEWEKWLRGRFGAKEGEEGVRIVKTSSYREQVGSDQVQGRMRIPDLPPTFRDELFLALKESHTELCRPPANVQTDPEKLKNWRSKVRSDISWDPNGQATEHFSEGLRGIDDGSIEDEDEHQAEGIEQQILTIGLIGQPNVGKSSLLNALFGERRVKASRTPGKTKHFQTLFLTPSVRLVDCPGLVFPAYIPMELQVLSSTLPISQIPSIPSCMHFVLRHIPLERIMALDHPDPEMKTTVDKRTWRADRPQNMDDAKESGQRWTTMDVLTAYALRNGWVTAKAGRPDVNRAGNALLRILTEAKIRWGFLPPGSALSGSTVMYPGNGIWIQGEIAGETSDEGEESDLEDEEEENELGSDDDGEEEEEEASDEGNRDGVILTGGRFGALSLDS